MAQTRIEKLESYVLAIVEDRLDDDVGWGVYGLRWGLKQLSRLFGAIVLVRLFLYEKRVIRADVLGCQVISVGNLTVGGTGKTPVVEVFSRHLQQAGRRVAILSRGYKKKEPSFIARVADGVLRKAKRRPPRVVSDGRRLLLDSEMSGDEPYMLASNLPDVCVLVDKDRVKSGRYAISKLGCDTLILDDGFQYLALQHHIDIVLVDCTSPFANGHVLPRGLLREPIRNIKRARYIFITKSDGTGTEELKAKLAELNSAAEIIECRHETKYLQNLFTGEHVPLDHLEGRPVSSISAIASPKSFENELVRLGAKLVYRKRFLDHHRYNQQEIIDMINASLGMGVDAIITTEKDAVRFPKMKRVDIPIYFLRVEIGMVSGEENFHDCISRICFKGRESGAVVAPAATSAPAVPAPAAMAAK